MSTLTVNPSVEGDVYGDNPTTWPPPDSDGAVGTDWFYGAGYNSSQYYTYNRLYRFDTSALTSGVTISAAKLRVYVTAKSVAGANSGVAGEYYDPGATINSADWVAMGSLAETAWAKVLASAVTASGWQEFDLLNPDANISKTGYTGIRVHSYFDGTPAGNNYIQANTMGGANKPELVITYSASTPIAATMNVPVTLTMGIKTPTRDRVRAMNLAVTLSMNGNYTLRPQGSGALSALSAMSGMIP